MTNPETPTASSTAATHDGPTAHASGHTEPAEPKPTAQSPAAAEAHVPAEAGGASHEAAHAGPTGPSGESGAEAEGGQEGHEPEGDEGEEKAEAGEAPGGGATADHGGEKKRRRRRRKKKGGAAADGQAPAEGGQSPEATAEGGSPKEEGGAPVEGKPHDKQQRDAKRKDKKHGPPRERPPVNAGDIVFGKIIEITDEAIIIDIPGKAHAIFDRRELLLPEEEESAKAAAAAAPSAEPSAEESAPTAHGAEAAPQEATEVAAATAEATPTQADAAAQADAPAAPAEAAADEVTAEAPSPEAAHEPAAPSPAPVHREPKVPRVVLEVGADFIGVVHNDGARGGLVVLTHHPDRAERTKPLLEAAYNEKTHIDGLVTGVIKGGIEVDVDGVRAFAPGSHVDMRLGADLSHLVSKRLPFLVTQYAKRGRDVVLSRKSMLEEEAKKTRAEALSRLKVGEEYAGVVRSVVGFGAFVDIGGIEGLVPLQEMSHNRADGPSDVFKAGEPTQVKVTKIDDRGKIWLSRKATIPDPWQQVAQKYAQGTRHSGKVVRIQPFGAFVELEPGIDGLIHTADLSIKRIESPTDVVKVGDAIEVVVSHVDQGTHKIALHPAPQGDEANEAPQRVAPHKPVKAKVVTIESGGLVVRILGVTGRNARGYVTAAGTGTPRGTELRKSFTVGQVIDAKVIEMDPRRGEVKLSIKALSEDQERNAYQQYRQQVKAEARFTFGDLLAKKGTPPR
jgi:small subunit ribosomal protein S1